MPEWLERVLNVSVGALVVALLVRYRDKGILKRIVASKQQFRSWVKGATK